MRFDQLAQQLDTLEHTSSRLEITAQLSRLWQQLELSEIIPTSYLLQGTLVPAYQSLEFQLSVKMIIRALARVAVAGGAESLFEELEVGRDLVGETQVSDRYKITGDLGTVAQESVATWRAAQGPPAQQLTIVAVYDQLVQIAQSAGTGSQERKLEALVQLFKQLDPLSAKFVTRIIIGKMRLGFSIMTMIDSLSWAMTGGKSDSKQLENAYQKKADIGLLAQTYLAQPDAESRSQALEAYTVEAGVPLVPALCQRLNSAAEIIEKLGTVIAEPKYDGMRVQIHAWREVVNGAETWRMSTYTRNLEETTHMFPELLEGVTHLQCQSCILDAEAIGYNPATGELLPFQETITRKRKHEVAAQATNVPIRFYVFDVLSLDGESFLQEELQKRKELLKGVFSQNKVLMYAPFITTTSAEELRAFHEQSLGEGLEGVVVKRIDSPYQSGRKGWQWVKIKEEEGTTGKLSDTIDAVILGYYTGRGKRAQFGIGAFLVGVPTADGELVTIAKVGTGLSEEQLGFFKERLDGLALAEKPALYQVAAGLVPDVWVSPQVVVEIAADELTTSPLHTAGVALRFPRLIKIRDDKSLEEATTLVELEQLRVLSEAKN